MSDLQIRDNILTGLRARLGISWEPSGSFLTNLESACSGAVGLLRSICGNPSLSFEEGEDYDLAVTCAWYLAENRRAEFLRDYNPDLNWLRLREAFKLGAFENSDVS